MSGFVMARGKAMALAGVRLLVVAQDGRRLHADVEVDADGQFALVFDDDPRAEWRRQGVIEIAFVALGRRPLGFAGRLFFPLDELPAIELLLLEEQELHAVTASTPSTAASASVGLNAQGSDVATIQAQLATVGYAVPASERSAHVYGVGTRDAVAAFQRSVQLADSGIVDALTRAALAAAVAARSGGHQLSGRVVLDNGLPAAGMAITLYNRPFGADPTRLASGTTDANGYYSIAYKLADASPTLEVRTVDAQGKELPLSSPRLAATAREVMNLVAPSAALPPASEYQRLTAALTPHLGGVALSQAREDDTRQDVTLLHQATGWDARLVALAAAAAQASDASGVPAEVAYALFRVGAATDADGIASLAPDDVDAGLQAARDASLVLLDDKQVSAAKAAIAAAAPKVLGAASAPGALDTFDAMLARTTLSATEKAAYATAYFANPDGGEALWQAAKAAGVSDTHIKALQLQGKLAYLTLNNAALTASLQSLVESPEAISKLADAGLYASASWSTRLRALAGNDAQKLDALIPPAYEGTSPDERLDAYAYDLARRVRLSFPTQAARQMIRADELVLGTQVEHTRDKPLVTTFLTKALALGFELGQPVGRFVEANRAALFDANTPPATIDTTIAAAKRLHRLYQIAPSSAALQAHYAAGFEGAGDIAKLPFDTFMQRHAARYNNDGEAELAYRKAQQVHANSYALVTAAKQLDDTINVYAFSGSDDDKLAAQKALVAKFPTLQSLFGSLDFCACADCRSVLSPAAYLVDLLHFIDRDDWSDFLAQWQLQHGAPYTPPLLKPFDALVARRPDLPNLPLTCENTNTALPYIDLVNEILEYQVAHGHIDADSGHDTGGAASADLLAEPQNILPDAYNWLKQQPYPIGLPFHLWLETVRRFLGHFDVRFSTLLDVMGKNAELFPPAIAPPPGYFRAAVFAEALAISPPEYDIFTHSGTTPSSWFEIYGYKTAAAALAALPNAKTLAGRLGLSYQELVDLVLTGFVNPNLDRLVALQRLAIPFDQVIAYKKGTLDAADLKAFTDNLARLKKERNFDVAAWIDTAWTNGDFGKMLLLVDAGAGCNFDTTTFKYDAADALPIDFHRLNFFVRLWRKLSWSMDEVDQALRVFIPHAETLDDTTIGPAMRIALVYLAHVGTLAARLPSLKNARVRLLTVWAPIPTFGANPLYRQLFNPAPGSVFDDVTGAPLTGGGKIADQQAAVQAAVNLTTEELAELLDPETADLTLDNVSLLYRHGLLAKALRLSVADLLSLISLSGLTPLAPLVVGPIDAIAKDVPLMQTLAFLDVAAAVKASGFKVDELAYLYQHRFDAAGKFADDSTLLFGLVRSLAGALKPILADNAVPSTISDDWLRQKLSLVLPADVVESFLGMWNGTIEYTATATAAALLVDAGLAADARVHLDFDSVTSQVTLTFRGVLVTSDESTLLGTVALPQQPFVSGLLEQVRATARSFFDRNLSDFLSGSDYDTLFTPLSGSDAVRQAALDAKRTLLANAVVDFFELKRMRQVIIQVLTAVTKADAALIEPLVTEVALLADPTTPTATLLDAFIGASKVGLSVSFFVSANGSGLVLAPAASATEGTTATHNGHAPGAHSASVDGYLEVPITGPYRFHVEIANAGTNATLYVGDGLDPLVPLTTAASDGDEASAFMVLQAGVPYVLHLLVGQLGAGEVTLSVEGESLARGSLARLSLRPQAAIDRIDRARILLDKALRLVNGFALDMREVRYLIGHAADFDGLSLSALPTTATSPAAPFLHFQRLAAYAQLKRDLGVGQDELVAIFEIATRNPAGALLPDLLGAVATLTRRKVGVVSAAAHALGIDTAPATSFASEKGLGQLWQLLQLAQTIGLPPDTIAAWTTPDPSMDTASAVRDAVKSRYDIDTWRAVAQGVFDALRRAKRDALVTSLLFTLQKDSVDALFEHFLIDPAMEPVVQTSRLRLAISSVQTFVQRCLLSLETAVSPAALDGDVWQWMKRYRVWEANRKIFLFPENWLEPEFREDKTNLYQAFEGALVQGDLSPDFAEELFLRYLKGLEEVARLDIVSTYLEGGVRDPHATLHVLGRTFGLPHKYFYRTRADGKWTPWEPIPASIEGDHVVIVKWRQRIHVYWVTFLAKQATPDVPDGNAYSVSTSSSQQLSGFNAGTHVDAQLSWTELFKGRWTPPAASGFDVVSNQFVDGEFVAKDVFVHVSGDDDTGLSIHLRGTINAAFLIVSKHAPPLSGPSQDEQYPPFRLIRPDATRWDQIRDPARMVAYWNDKKRIGKKTIPVAAHKTVLGAPPSQFTLTPVDDEVYLAGAPDVSDPNGYFELGPILAPFFYADRTATFFVEPSAGERTVPQHDGGVLGPPRPGIKAGVVLRAAEPGVIHVGPQPDPAARYVLSESVDHLVGSTDTVRFGTANIGAKGQEIA